MMLQRKPISQILRDVFLSPNALSRLILANSALWLLLYIIGIPVFLFSASESDGKMLIFSKAMNLFAIPASVDQFLSKPWTIITYMLYHVSFFHLFFNMYVLWFFGKIFLQFFNNSKLYVTYFTGGIIGALVFMGAFNIFPVFNASIDSAIALGASASVLAIVVFTALRLPEYKMNLLFIGEIRLLHLAIVFIVIDILLIPVSNSGGHFAHLGGALAGSLLFLIDRIKPLRLTFYLRRFKNIIGGFFKSNEKTKKSGKPVTDEEYNTQRALNQKKTDAILEKISKSGYSSLSKEEKEYLFKQSGK